VLIKRLSLVETETQAWRRLRHLLIHLLTYFTDSFLNDSRLRHMRNLSHYFISLTSVDIMDPPIITAALFSTDCSFMDSDLGYQTASKMNCKVSHARFH